MSVRLKLTAVLALALALLPLISLAAPRKAEQPEAPSPEYVLILLGDEPSRVDMREYIKGAVAAQMPIDLEEAALSAQAVLAHTYALRRRREETLSPTPGLSGADIGSDPAVYQAYLTEEQRRELYGSDFRDAEAKLSAAADYALTRSLTFEGEPIIAAFHAVSAGKTESAKDAWGTAVPYLQSVESPSDAEEKLCASKSEFTAEELSEKLKKAFPELKLSDPLTVEVTQRTEGGAAGTVSVCGSSFLSGSDFAAALGLASAHFEVSEDGGKLLFSCLGRGHLVGMSQLGANSMAKAGASCEEILSHYFPNARLTDNSAVK